MHANVDPGIKNMYVQVQISRTYICCTSIHFMFVVRVHVLICTFSSVTCTLECVPKGTDIVTCMFHCASKGIDIVTCMFECRQK